MTYPDKQRSIHLLEQWQKLHSDLDAVHDAAKKVFGCEPESPFFDTTWRVFDAYTRALSVQLGELSGTWLDWYQSENEMGAKGHEAGYAGKLNPIINLDGLYELILQARVQG
jgi:hypothetical protein